MAKVKDSVQGLVGKTIDAVVLTRNFENQPQSQLFLCFEDGTSYEMWVDNDLIQMASRLDEEGLEEVTQHLRNRDGTTMFIFDKSGRRKKE